MYIYRRALYISVNTVVRVLRLFNYSSLLYQHTNVIKYLSRTYSITIKIYFIKFRSNNIHSII